MNFTGLSKDVVTLYSRHGCHLCEVALETLDQLRHDLKFEIEVRYIDGITELEQQYGEQVPVTLINGEHHDFWRVDPERFREHLERSRRHR